MNDESNSKRRSSIRQQANGISAIRSVFFCSSVDGPTSAVGWGGPCRPARPPPDLPVSWGTSLISSSSGSICARWPVRSEPYSQEVAEEGREWLFLRQRCALLQERA